MSLRTSVIKYVESLQKYLACRTFSISESYHYWRHCIAYNSSSHLPACFHVVGTDFWAPESDVECASGHQTISAVSIGMWGAKKSGWKESLVNKIIHAEVSSFACYCWWRREGTKCEMWDMESKSSVRHVIYCLLEYQKWNTGAACWTDGSPLTHEVLFIKNNLCFRFLRPWVPHTWRRIPSPDKQHLLQVWLCSIFLEHPLPPPPYHLQPGTLNNSLKICPTLIMFHTLGGVKPWHNPMWKYLLHFVSWLSLYMLLTLPEELIHSCRKAFRCGAETAKGGCLPFPCLERSENTLCVAYRWTQGHLVNNESEVENSKLIGRSIVLLALIKMRMAVVFLSLQRCNYEDIN